MDPQETELEELKASLQCPVCHNTLKKPVKILPCLHSFCCPCLEAVILSSVAVLSSSSLTPPSSASATTPTSSTSSAASTPTPSSAASTPTPSSSASEIPNGTVGQKREREDQTESHDSPPEKMQKVEPAPLLLPCLVCRREFSVPWIDDKPDLSSLPDNHVAHSLLDRLSPDPSQPPSEPQTPHVVSPQSQETRDKTLALVKDVQDRRKHIQTSLSLIDQMETKTQKAVLTQKDAIVSSFESLKQDTTKQIDERKETLLRELDEKTNEKLSKLTQQRKQLERDLEHLDNSVSVSRTILKNATDEQLESHLPHITNQLTRLKEDESLLQLPVETKKLEFVEVKTIDLTVLLQDFQLQEKLSGNIEKAIEIRGIINGPRDYSTIGTPKLTFGTKGSEDGEFDNPWGVTVDHNDNILVSDYDNHRVQIFDKQGNHLKSIGVKGSEDGRFDCPVALAVDHHNHILVCDSLNHRVQIFDEEGKHIKSFGSKGSEDGQFDQPRGMAVSHHNNIIVSDTYNDRVQVFDDQGNHIRSFGSKGSEDGQFNYLGGVAVDNHNNIIVCDIRNNRIQVLDEEGKHIRSFGSKGTEDGQFDFPREVAVDHHNNIIVCDSRNHRVQIFDEEGKHIKSFGSLGSRDDQFVNPQGVAVCNQNNILVCDFHNHRVQIF